MAPPLLYCLLIFSFSRLLLLNFFCCQFLPSLTPLSCRSLAIPLFLIPILSPPAFLSTPSALMQHSKKSDLTLMHPTTVITELKSAQKVKKWLTKLWLFEFMATMWAKLIKSIKRITISQTSLNNPNMNSINDPSSNNQRETELVDRMNTQLSMTRSITLKPETISK